MKSSFKKKSRIAEIAANCDLLNPGKKKSTIHIHIDLRNFYFANVFAAC